MAQKHLYWFNKKCCVTECSNSSTEGPGCYKEYFDLPAEPQARKRWLSAICIKDGDDLKICEDHFQDDDVFRDKNNRKKLRVNSIPSLVLSKPNVCTSCLGFKNPAAAHTTSKICQCERLLTPKQPPTEQPLRVERPCTPIKPVTAAKPNSTPKRSRLKWTADEKYVLFKVIKSYGDVKVGSNKIRINWTNVATHCRSKGCFGNEKELKTVWQYMRINAAKVYRNEIFGSKLDRKVSKFLFGKSLKKNRRKINNNNNNQNDESLNENMEAYTTTTEDDDQRVIRPTVEDGEKEELDSTAESGIVDEDIEEIDANEEESDEYYTLSDVEQIYHIKIRPRVLNEPLEVVSLLSSGED